MKPLRAILVTVSDSRGPSTDASGPAMRAALETAGVAVVEHKVIRDEPVQVAALVREVAGADAADVIVLSGGTGIAPRDTTPEALEAVYDKALDGFGEAFRRLSWAEVGVRAVFSRASAGVVGGTIVFSLPGSPAAVRLGMRELVVPMIPHAIALLRSPATAHEPSVAATPRAPANAMPAAIANSPRRVRVLYFAALRELAGRAEDALDLPAGVNDVPSFLAHLAAVRPEVAAHLASIRVARNEELATTSDPIEGGDVLALLPPFAGG